MHKNKWVYNFHMCKKQLHGCLFYQTLSKLKMFKAEYPDVFRYQMKVLQCDEDIMFTEKS